MYKQTEWYSSCEWVGYLTVKEGANETGNIPPLKYDQAVFT